MLLRILIRLERPVFKFADNDARPRATAPPCEPVHAAADVPRERIDQVVVQRVLLHERRRQPVVNSHI